MHAVDLRVLRAEMLTLWWWWCAGIVVWPVGEVDRAGVRQYLYDWALVVDALPAPPTWGADVSWDERKAQVLKGWVEHPIRRGKKLLQRVWVFAWRADIQARPPRAVEGCGIAHLWAGLCKNRAQGEAAKDRLHEEQGRVAPRQTGAASATDERVDALEAAITQLEKDLAQVALLAGAANGPAGLHVLQAQQALDLAVTLLNMAQPLGADHIRKCLRKAGGLSDATRQTLFDSLLLPAKGAKLSNEDTRVLRKQVQAMFAREEGAAAIGHVGAADPVPVMGAIKAQASQGIVGAIACQVVEQARPFLALLSGMIAERTSQVEYDQEIMGLSNAMRRIFGGAQLLVSRKEGKAALDRHLPPAPEWTRTVRTDSAGKVISVGMHLSIKALLDYLSLWPGWNDALQGSKRVLGLCASTDGAKLTRGIGICATAVWLLNTCDLCQSARHTFTVALSSGGDSVDEMRIHHDPTSVQLRDLEGTGWQHPASSGPMGHYNVRWWRVADGKVLCVSILLCANKIIINYWHVPPSLSLSCTVPAAAASAIGTVLPAARCATDQHVHSRRACVRSWGVTTPLAPARAVVVPFSRRRCVTSGAAVTWISSSVTGFGATLRRARGRPRGPRRSGRERWRGGRPSVLL